jgi:L-alanine-DL-glutamate epimerase-like enolase superfamily enzyme
VSGAAAQYCRCFTAYAPWLTAQATDDLRGDVAVKGGITALVKTGHLAEAFHLNFEVHRGRNSLNNVANLHVNHGPAPR